MTSLKQFSDVCPSTENITCWSRMKKGKDSGKGPPPKANGKSTTPPTTPAKSRGGITIMNRSGTPPPSGGITLIGKKAEGMTLIGKNAEANGGITLIGKKAEQNGVPTPIGKKADTVAGISLIRKSQSSNELPPQGLPPSGRPASQASSSGNAPEVSLVRRSHSATDIAAQEMEELRLYSEGNNRNRVVALVVRHIQGPIHFEKASPGCIEGCLLTFSELCARTDETSGLQEPIFR